MENLTGIEVLENLNLAELCRRAEEISAEVLRAERASQSRKLVASHLKSFVENMSEASYGCISAVAAVQEVQDVFLRGEADQQNTETLCGEADQDHKKQTHCVKMKMWRLWSDLATEMLQQDEEAAALRDKEVAWHHEYQELVISLEQNLQDSKRRNEELIAENMLHKESIRLLKEEVAKNEEIIKEKTKEVNDEEEIRRHYERSCERWIEENRRLTEEMKEMIIMQSRNSKRSKEDVTAWDSWNKEQEVVDAANKKVKMLRWKVEMEEREQ